MQQGPGIARPLPDGLNFLADEPSQRPGIHQHDAAALEAHPFALLPGTQLLVCALARRADDVAEFPLGNTNGR
jgi:hypothetical protein